MIFKICTIIALATILTECMAEESILDDVKSEIIDLGEQAKSAAETVVDVVRENVDKGMENVKETAISAKEAVEESVENAKEHVEDAKDNVAERLEDGESFIDKIGKHVNEAGKTIKSAMHSVGEKLGEATDFIGEKIGIAKSKSEAIDMRGMAGASDEGIMENPGLRAIYLLKHPNEREQQ